MSKYNETKIKALECLSTYFEATTLEVALEIDVSHGAARACLGRCYRWGLLSRHKEPGSPRTFLYSLNLRGVERLEWLQEQEKRKEVNPTRNELCVAHYGFYRIQLCRLNPYISQLLRAGGLNNI